MEQHHIKYGIYDDTVSARHHMAQMCYVEFSNKTIFMWVTTD